VKRARFTAPARREFLAHVAYYQTHAILSIGSLESMNAKQNLRTQSSLNCPFLGTHPA
jgi:hypothetical protein